MADTELTRTRTMGPTPESTSHSSAFLYVVLQGSAVQRAPSRHRLDTIDVVDVGRGSGVRSVREGHRLNLCIDDPWMSVEHVQLRRGPTGWSVQDAGSKNGTHVLEAAQRDGESNAAIAFRTGQTFFMLSPSCHHDGEAAQDLDADELSGPLGVRTLQPDLARDFERLRLVAASETPVILGGETGTGKELVARAVHELSGRSGKFAAVNCASLSESLIESELFGHRKGAFSGATGSRDGWVVAADGGTLLLDEIGELPLPAQAALLRVLQEREVVPVGATTPRKVDVRFVCATHRDLEADVTQGRFREDLLGRLAGFRFGLPPLRDRLGDLGVLLRHFAASLTPETVRISADAGEALIRYRWPRNVRELGQALQVAVAVAPDHEVELEHLPPAMRETPDAAPEHDDPTASRVAQLLREHGGNVTEVARAMGKHRQQIQKWIRRFGIDVHAFRRAK